MSRLVLFNQIADQLSDYASRITRKNKLNLTDEANFSEDTAAEVLSEVFLLALTNVNTGKANVTAVDLEDEENQVKVQVTTIASGFPGKKKSTIDKFLDEPAYGGIKTLYLLFITNERLPADVLGTEEIREGCQYKGHDLNSLLALIKTKNVTTQEKILQIVDAEFGSYKDIAGILTPGYPEVDHYIERRYLVPGSTRSLFGYWSDTEQRKSLLEMVNEKLLAGKPARFLLRADAAMGKSQELQQLAHYFSDLSKEVLPVWISLKNFDGDLDAYIAHYQQQWKRIKPRQLLLLLDGIDEVAIGLLEGFLRKFNQLLQANPLIHIIATIRTNFDASEIGAGIDERRRLQEIMLGPVTDTDIDWYIRRRLDHAGVLRFRQFTALNWVSGLIYNPFYLANITEMTVTPAVELPSSRPELIARFIQLRNEKDSRKYHSQIDIPGITVFSVKLALYLVLTGSNTVNTRLLADFTTLTVDQLKRSSLLRISVDGFDTFIGFDHNNFQEYLAARELAKLPWADLQPLLFHEVMPDLLKPKMVNTTNFLFSLVPDTDPIFAPLLDKLIAGNIPALLKFERDKIGRARRLDIFKAIVAQGNRDKIYWLGGDIRANELAAFTKWSPASLDHLVELLTQEAGYYPVLCLLDLCNYYPESSLSPAPSGQLLNFLRSLIASPEAATDHLGRAIEVLIHFKLQDNSLLADLKNLPRADLAEIRLLLLKYINAINPAGEFDYCLHSAGALSRSSRSYSLAKEEAYTGYLAAHLDAYNAANLLEYFTENDRLIEQILNNSTYLRGVKPIEKIYDRLAGIYLDSRDQALWDAFIAFVQKISNRPKAETVWGNVMPFFTRSGTQEQAFFILFSYRNSIHSRRIMGELFESAFIPKLFREKLEYRVLHRFGNILWDHKHPDALIFREAMEREHPVEQADQPWLVYQEWHAAKRIRDVELLGSREIFLDEVRRTYEIFQAEKSKQPGLSLLSFQYEDGPAYRGLITNNVAYETINEEDRNENFEDFEKWFGRVDWQRFVYGKIVDYLQDKEYCVPEAQQNWATGYLRNERLPQFSFRDFVVRLYDDEHDLELLESLGFFFMRDLFNPDKRALEGMIYLCGLGVIDSFGGSSTFAPASDKILGLLGREAFEACLIDHLQDENLPEFVLFAQTGLADHYGCTGAIPFLLKYLSSDQFSADYKDGLVDSIKKLSDDREIFVPLFDQFTLIERRWQFSVCSYLLEESDFREDVVRLFEHSALLLADAPANFWAYQMAGLAIQNGSLAMAETYLGLLRGKKKLPEYSSVRPQDFERLSRTHSRCLIDICLDLLPETISNPNVTNYERSSEFLEEIIRMSAVRDPVLITEVNQSYDRLIATRGTANPDFDYIQWYKIRLKKAFSNIYQDFDLPTDAWGIIRRLAV